MLEDHSLKIKLDASDADKQAEHLAISLEKTGIAADKTQVAFERLKIESDKTKQALKILKGENEQVSKALKELRDRNKDLEVAVRSLREENTTLKKSLHQLENQSDSTSKGVNVLKRSLVSLLATMSLMGSVKAVADDFMVFESGLVSIGKTADMEGRSLELLGDEITNLTLKIPAIKKNLLEVEAAGAQLGVRGSANLMKFGETMTRLEKASDIMGEEGSKQIIRVLNVTKEGVGVVDEFASVIVRLGNSFAASESEILRMSTEIARSTAIFGVSAAESAALGATMRSLGIRAELGGSAVGRSFRTISKAIREGGDEFESLQRITGMTGEALRKTFEYDAVAVFQKFLEGIGRIEEKSRGASTGALEEFKLKGEEILKVLPPLALNSQLFARALSEIKDEAGSTNALITESDKAFNTLESQTQLAKNAIDAVSTSLGARFAPSLKSAAKGISEFNKNAEEVEVFTNHLLLAGKALLALGAAKYLGPILATGAAFFRTTVVVNALGQSITTATAKTRMMAVTANSMTVATNGLRAALGFLGGPVGVALLAASAITYFATASEEATPAAKAFSREVDELNASLKEMTWAERIYQESGLEADIQLREYRIKKLREELEGLSTATYEFGQDTGIAFRKLELIKSIAKLSNELKENQIELDKTSQLVKKLNDQDKRLNSANSLVIDGLYEQSQALKKLLGQLKPVLSGAEKYRHHQTFLAKELKVVEKVLGNSSKLYKQISAAMDENNKRLLEAIKNEGTEAKKLKALVDQLNPLKVATEEYRQEKELLNDAIAIGGEGIDLYQSSMETLDAEYLKSRDHLLGVNKILDDFTSKVGKSAGGTQLYEESLEALKKVLAGLPADYGDLERAVGQLDAAFKESQDQVNETAKVVESTMGNAGENIQDLFSDFFHDIFKDGDNAFKNLADNIKKTYLKLVSELAAKKLFETIFGDGKNNNTSRFWNSIGEMFSSSSTSGENNNSSGFMNFLGGLFGGGNESDPSTSGANTSSTASTSSGGGGGGFMSMFSGMFGGGGGGGGSGSGGMMDMFGGMFGGGGSGGGGSSTAAASEGSSAASTGAGSYLGMIGMGYAGAQAGESMFGKSEYSTEAEVVGGVIGAYYGGEYGAAIGAFLGAAVAGLTGNKALDSVMGTLIRGSSDSNIPKGSNQEFLLDSYKTASGLWLWEYNKRGEEIGVDFSANITSALRLVDQQLYAMTTALGFDIDFSEFGFVDSGKGGSEFSARTRDGNDPKFYAGTGNKVSGVEEFDTEFLMRWVLSAVEHQQLPAEVGHVFKNLTGDVDELSANLQGLLTIYNSMFQDNERIFADIAQYEKTFELLSETFRLEGENLVDTLQRLKSTDQLLQRLGLSDTLTTVTAEFGHEVLQVAGGINNLTALVNGFTQSFYTEEEVLEKQIDYMRNMLSNVFASMDLELSDFDSLQQFREQFDLVKESLDAVEVVKYLEAGNALNLLINYEERLAELRQQEVGILGELTTSIDDIIKAAAESSQAILSLHARIQNDINQLTGSTIHDLRAQLTTSSGDEQLSAIDNYRQAIISQYREQGRLEAQLHAEKIKSYEQQLTLAKDLRAFTESLIIGSLSPLTSIDKFNEAQARFDQLATLAKTGDIEAATQLKDAGSELLNLARPLYTSSQQYTNIFDATTGTIDQVANVLENAQDPGNINDVINSSLLSELQSLNTLLNSLQIDVGNELLDTLNNLNVTLEQLPENVAANLAFIIGNVIDAYIQSGVSSTTVADGIVNTGNQAVINATNQYLSNNNLPVLQTYTSQGILAKWNEFQSHSSTLAEAVKGAYQFYVDHHITSQAVADALNVPRSEILHIADVYGLPAFGEGGIATTASLFGERGPELAIPLPSGQTIEETLHQYGIGPGKSDHQHRELMEAMAKQLHIMMEQNELLRDELEKTREHNERLNSALVSAVEEQTETIEEQQQVVIA